MKKALLVAGLILIITLPLSAQQYWNLKTAFQGLVLKPGDSNGLAYGGALMATFGAPDGKYEIGFEAAKWWRSFSLHDHFIDSLIQIDKLARSDDLSKRDQQGLQFSVLVRYRFYQIMEQGRLDAYSGLGGGFYFLQERRQEARLNPTTGYWDVEWVDKYLDTKPQSFVMLGFVGQVANKLDLFLEGRFTKIFNWDRWDNSRALSASLGLKYIF